MTALRFTDRGMAGRGMARRGKARQGSRLTLIGGATTNVASRGMAGRGKSRHGKTRAHLRKGIRRMKTQYVFRYMEERAEVEAVAFELTPKFFEAHFKQGVRSFFGVRVDEQGVLLSDAQNPKFFDSPRGTCMHCCLLPFTSAKCGHYGRPVRG